MSRFGFVVPPMTRRKLLTVTAAGVSLAAIGSPRCSFAAHPTVRWVSPRGTVEVLDDYPYWVSKKFGYFGDIDTTLEPGPLEATATVKLVDQIEADVGYPSPGVFSLALAQGIPLISVFEMGGADVYDFAFRKGEKPPALTALEGKTVVLGSTGWQAIANPLLAAAGVDISKVKYVEAGDRWGQALAQGQGDAALSWEGLRAQWKGQGLDFDYVLGKSFSKFPTNSFVIRKADFGDAGKRDLYARYLRGWAMGLEFGRENPRAATHIVMRQFPDLASHMTPPIATESQMELASAFAGRWDERMKWGFQILSSWQAFFDTSKRIGQLQVGLKAEDAIKNDLIDGANDFDHAKVKTDAADYTLPVEYRAVDIAALANSL